LRHEYGPQVEVDRQLEIGHIYTFDRRGTGVADMVPDKVEPAELVGRAADDVASEGILAQIAGDADRLATRGGDLGHDDVDAGFVNIHDPDRGALAGEAQRAGTAHAGSCRGNDADLVRQAHGRLLPQCRNLS
jgi:hypothetical protein